MLAALLLQDTDMKPKREVARGEKIHFTAPPAKNASKFVDRDLCKTNPMQEQFEPAGPEPVRQRAKMGGQS